MIITCGSGMYVYVCVCEGEDGTRGNIICCNRFIIMNQSLSMTWWYMKWYDDMINEMKWYERLWMNGMINGRIFEYKLSNDTYTNERIRRE